jgi:hypothetical protein
VANHVRPLLLEPSEKVTRTAAQAGGMRLFQHQPRQCGYLIRCIHSVDDVMYFGPRGFDCVCATSGPIMSRRFRVIRLWVRDAGRSADLMAAARDYTPARRHGCGLAVIREWWLHPSWNSQYTDVHPRALSPPTLLLRFRCKARTQQSRRKSCFNAGAMHLPL